LDLSRAGGITGDCKCDCDCDGVSRPLSPIVASLPFLGITLLNAAAGMVRPPGGNDAVDETLDMTGADISGDPRLEEKDDLVEDGFAGKAGVGKGKSGAS